MSADLPPSRLSSGRPVALDDGAAEPAGEAPAIPAPAAPAEAAPSGAAQDVLGGPADALPAVPADTLPAVSTPAAPSPAARPGHAAGGPAARRPRPPKPSVWAQTWHYLRDPRRRTYVVLGAIATLGLLGFGVYAIVDGPPPTVEGVVYFTGDATTAQKDAVRRACPSVGGAIEEPPDRNNLAITRVYPLRYNFTNASTSDRAKVIECVQGRPGVIGLNTETQGQ